jgi:hypothetical protein
MADWHTWVAAGHADLKAAVDGPLSGAEEHLNDAIACIQMAIDALEKDEEEGR